MTSFKIGGVGLGYAGLPLAVALARKHPVVGFDIDRRRIAALRGGRDVTNEVSPEELGGCDLRLTDDPGDLRDSNVIIVTVPTPIDEANRPNLRKLLSACAAIGPVLSPGIIVVFESTSLPRRDGRRSAGRHWRPRRASVQALTSNWVAARNASTRETEPGR